MHIHPRALLIGAALGTVIAGAGAAVALGARDTDPGVAVPVFDEPPASSPLVSMPPVNTDEIDVTSVPPPPRVASAVAERVRPRRPAPAPRKAVEAPRPAVAAPRPAVAAPRPATSAPRPSAKTQRHRDDHHGWRAEIRRAVHEALEHGQGNDR